MTDRVQVSFTYPLALSEYRNTKIHAGFDTEVREGETEREAFERAAAMVDERLGILVRDLKDKIS